MRIKKEFRYEKMGSDSISRIFTMVYIRIDNKGNWMFTDLTIGTFMQPLKDTKEYWIFFVEMIYKLYKCDMIEFPIRMLVGTKNLEEFY